MCERRVEQPALVVRNVKWLVGHLARALRLEQERKCVRVADAVPTTIKIREAKLPVFPERVVSAHPEIGRQTGQAVEKHSMFLRSVLDLSLL